LEPLESCSALLWETVLDCRVSQPVDLRLLRLFTISAAVAVLSSKPSLTDFTVRRTDFAYWLILASAYGCFVTTIQPEFRCSRGHEMRRYAHDRRFSRFDHCSYFLSLC
jgi:hypothetical protein